MQVSSLEQLGLLVPRPDTVTVGEVNAECVHLEGGFGAAGSVRGLDRRWAVEIKQPEPLRLEGAGFDIFLEPEALGSTAQIVSTVSKAWDLLASSVRQGVFGPSSSASGGSVLVSFHWSDDRVAVASLDEDAIQILNMTGPDIPEWERPALKSNRMCNIQALAFRPFTGSTIAAGCDRGVAIWRRREVSYLTRAAHAPVSSVEWTTDGNILATASPNDGAVVLWDVGTKEGTPLYAISGGSRLLRWSRQNPSLLLVSSPRRANFQVWDSASWKSSTWVDLSGPISSCCWSSDGTTLLIAPWDEPVIHAFRFEKKTAASDSPASISHYLNAESTAACLAAYEGEPDGDDISTTVGGVARLMAWDSTGERLAAAFHTEQGSDGNNLVAVFSTRLRPTFRMTHTGWIRGPVNSGPPVSLAFKPSFRGGALLAILWSSKALSFVQMRFRPSEKFIEKG